MDPTASPQHLRNVDVSSQLFLTSKCARGEQLGSLSMLLGGFLVGPSKTSYATTTLRLTQIQKDSAWRVIQRAISKEVHGRLVLRVLTWMLPL
jgi:hypothetical protein